MRVGTGEMRARRALQCSVLAFAFGMFCGAALAQGLDDEIFNSGAEPGIVLKGRAGYPAGNSHAVIELHLGTYVATTQTQNDGSYQLFVETSHLQPLTIAELRSFATGSDSIQSWAGALGPTDRLLTLVDNGAIAFPAEPFLNLNPRSTSIAAALRAYNNFSPIADKTTFYKAARSYQVQTDQIAFGLAMIARGNQTLPAGATTTWDAVLSLARLQQVFHDEQALIPADCGSAPTAPFCVVQATLPIDPAIVPTHPLADGRIYAGTTGFDFGVETLIGFRPNGASMDMFGFGPTPITGDVTFEADGSETLTRSGGLPFATNVTFPVINGGQVEQDDTVYKIRLRTTLGPGGQSEAQGAPEHTYTYPGHPELSYTASDPWGMPGYMGADPLPPELAALVPDVTNGKFVLASPFATVDPIAPYGYDVYNFSTSTGAAARSAKTFSFSGAGTPLLSLDFAADSTSSDVNFINEESPGVWRVRMHAIGPSSDRIFDGLLMETIGVAGGFTGANVPATYEVNLNGYACGGPYGEIETFCSSLLVWTMHADNSVDRADFGGLWGAWQLGTGADVGRLLLARPSFAATPIKQMRGWELVRSNGPDDTWVLENVTNSPGGSTSAPPVVFYPSTRLAHVLRSP